MLDNNILQEFKIVVEEERYKLEVFKLEFQNISRIEQLKKYRVTNTEKNTTLSEAIFFVENKEKYCKRRMYVFALKWLRLKLNCTLLEAKEYIKCIPELIEV